MKNWKSVLFLLSFVFLSQGEACTGIKLEAKDKTFVFGRTLEFGQPVEISIGVIPRGYPFQGTTAQGAGLSYKAKYGAVGAIAFGQVALMDGMNEKGLSVGTFYFPGYAEYALIDKNNQKKALGPVEFPNWIVTQFSTVEEVKANLEQVVISPVITEAWGPTPAPFHYIVSDKSGNSIVIEPIKGKLVVSENPLGVLTNSPNFEWHLTYLRNFLNLTPYNEEPVVFSGIKLSPFGQGSGMVGLPGDFTPPSRFVKAALFCQTASPVENAKEAIFQGFHILNQFDIPIGIAREKVDGATYMDSTLITCMRDPNNLKYYFKTYDDQRIKMVDLKFFDLDIKEIKTITIQGKDLSAIDLSSNAH